MLQGMDFGMVFVRKVTSFMRGTMWSTSRKWVKNWQISTEVRHGPQTGVQSGFLETFGGDNIYFEKGSPP